MGSPCCSVSYHNYISVRPYYIIIQLKNIIWIQLISMLHHFYSVSGTFITLSVVVFLLQYHSWGYAVQSTQLKVAYSVILSMDSDNPAAITVGSSFILALGSGLLALTGAFMAYYAASFHSAYLYLNDSRGSASTVTSRESTDHFVKVIGRDSGSSTNTDYEYPPDVGDVDSADTYPIIELANFSPVEDDYMSLSLKGRNTDVEKNMFKTPAPKVKKKAGVTFSSGF